MLSGTINLHKEGFLTTVAAGVYPNKQDVEQRILDAQHRFKVGEVVWIKSSNEYAKVEEWPKPEDWCQALSHDRKNIYETRVRNMKGILVKLAHYGLDKVEDAQC